MTNDPNGSGDYIRPLPQYLDNLIVEHPVIGTCELWKAIAWDTAQLRNYKMKRADSAGTIAAEAQKGAPSGQPKHAPPLVADAASKDKDEASVMERVYSALSDFETRLDALEARKRELDEEAAHREIAEKALMLAEEIAESAPAQLLIAIRPAQPEKAQLTMPIREICSPNSSGQKPKPQPLPGSDKTRRVKHAAVYRRGDQIPDQPSDLKSTRDCDG